MSTEMGNEITLQNIYNPSENTPVCDFRILITTLVSSNSSSVARVVYYNLSAQQTGVFSEGLYMFCRVISFPISVLIASFRHRKEDYKRE
jgi:hypothetical protein